jgi:hypothetical protein
VCLAGASSVRSDILAKHPDAPLIVYAIWTDKLFRDSRSQWDAGGLTDHRVVHFWDGRDISGSWFVHHLPGYQGNDWDAYALFGPDATWTDSTLPAVVVSGSNIIDRFDALRVAVSRVLAAQPSGTS